MVAQEKVIITDAAYNEDAMAAAVERIFEKTPFSFRGRTVLVKPNMSAQCKVEKAATTHPSLIKAVVDGLRRRGAKKIIVGDNPGATAYGINEKCARTTGILDAAGECYVNLMKRPQDLPIQSQYLDHVNISSEFLECDYFINLPKLKGHAHAYMTGSIKNLYGMCVGGEKSRLHALGKDAHIFAEILVDVFSARPPDLNIVDAVIGMEGNGPTNGHPRPVGKLVAGVNGFAVDAVCADMIGYKIEKITTLAVGKARGLWSGNPAGIQVDGEYPKIKKFKPPVTFGAYTVFNRIMSPFISCLPVLAPKRCLKCGLCAAQCPVGACTCVKGEFPQIDKIKCIKCYCCQEFCPGDAIELSGRMLKLTTLMAGTTRKI